MSDYVNFQEISQVPFDKILNWMNIPYSLKGKAIKGQGFVISTDKNLYFGSVAADKGGPINFVANRKQIPLRDAAILIRDTFLQTPKPKELPDYQLQYHPFLKEQGIWEDTAKLFDVGYCKTGIMKGKIAFALHDEQGNKVAYIGKNLGDGWFFPKNFKSDYLYNLHRQKHFIVILTLSPLDVLKLHQEHIPVGLALITASMSERQETLLRPFKRILLIHPQPDNIASRLVRNHYVKALNSAESWSEDYIRSLL